MFSRKTIRNNHWFKTFSLAFFFVLGIMGGTTLFAQQYTIEGRVMAEDTEEPLPFVTVYLSQAQSGVATDLDGFFSIKTDLASDTLVISAVSYKTIKIPLKDSVYQVINVTMFANDYMVSELVVYAGENPANAIVKNIIKNKKNNRLSSFDGYEVEQYTKIELDLYNFNNKMFDKKALKPFDFVLDNVDSTSDEKVFLPGYINEEIAKVYGIAGRQNREVLTATRVSGVDGTTAVKQIQRLTAKYNIYDNWIPVLERNFVSPFSNSGLLFYEYYIMDSTSIKGQWSYKLKFKPRRKQETTFYGEFWVVDTTFAIQQVSMRKSPDVNINMVDRVVIFEEFDLTENGWLPQKQKLLVDFLPLEKLPGMIARKTTTFKNYNINRSDAKTRYETASPEDVKKEDLEKSEDFWVESRHENLSSNEEMIYQMVDSIKNSAQYRKLSNAAYTLSSGWLKIGKLEIGEYFNAFGINEVEGNRFRMGLGTNLDFSKKYRGEVFAAYGTKDKKWKYGGEFHYNIKESVRREQVFVSYFNDVVFTNRSSEDAISSSTLSSFARRETPQRILHAEETKAYYLKDFKKGLTVQATFLHRTLDPYGKIYADGSGFNFSYLNPVTNEIDTTTNSAEFTIKFRHAYKEQFLSGFFDRISTGGRYPIYYLQYTKGVKGIMGSQYNYHKVEFDFFHWFYLSPIGWTSYRIRAGKTFGTLPSLLLEVHPGNETFFYSSTGFNLMNRYEFTSDAYVSWQITHHFDGLFLNKIPLLRKLDWRSLAHFRGVWGSLSAANQTANQFNTSDSGGLIPFRAPSAVPYMEVGVGIENILKIFQIHASWRLNYLDNPEAIPFVLQGGIYFNF